MFTLTETQRERLTEMVRAQLRDHDWSTFNDFELLMASLVAAFTERLTPDQARARFRELGIDPAVVMAGISVLHECASDIRDKLSQRN